MAEHNKMYSKEYKKQKGDPKGRKYKCYMCNNYTYQEGKKLEIDEAIVCDNCTE